MAKKILRSPEGVRSPRVIHPKREWLIGLVIGVVGFSASVAWAVHEYRLYRYITITDYTATEQTVIYRENMVKDSLDMFTQRAEEHQSLLNQAGAVKSNEIVEIEAPTEEVINVEDSGDTAEEGSAEEIEPIPQE